MNEELDSESEVLGYVSRAFLLPSLANILLV